MRLKSIELTGFKSFVDRTVVQFETGITGIVGPNGSGKSNIVDAIRWVMGEQSAKHLRGGEMLDVIFAGSQNRAPMGMASVFITFDNSDGRAPAEYADYAEITVGRRLYRSGESEYFVNKTPCRLKDIVDLFLGTGTGTKAYSIVEQGRIGQIVSSKPEERRMLLEEAAGISKFRNRRETAQRRMEATEANLVRLRDIVNEIERQLGSLQRQAKKAEKHREYTTELRSLELGASAQQWLNGQNEFTNVSGELEIQRTAETSAFAALQGHEAHIETERVELVQLESDLTTAQNAYYALHNELQLIESQVEQQQRHIREREVTSHGAEREIADLDARLQLWREALSQANDTKVSADLAVAEAELSLAEGEARITGFRDELRAVEAALAELERVRMQAERGLATTRARGDELARRDAELTTAQETLHATLEQLAKQMKSVTEQLRDERELISGREQQTLLLGEERSALELTLKDQQAELSALETQAAQGLTTLEQVKSRLSSLEELARNFEGYGDGVKALLKPDGESPIVQGTLLGTLADVVDITDTRCEIAVAAWLAENAQGVLVDAPTTAAACIDFLKTRAQGRGTFLPIVATAGQAAALLQRAANPEDLRSGTSTTHASEAAEVAALCGASQTSILPALEGVIGWMSAAVSTDATYATIVQSLLTNAVIVTTLDVAFAARAVVPTLAYITLDGEVLHTTGAVCGGSGGEATRAILARRRECETLRTQVAQAQIGYDSVMELKRRCQERIGNLHERASDVAKTRHQQEVELAQRREQLKSFENEQTRLAAEQEKTQTQCTRAMQEYEVVVTEREACEARIIAFDAERIVASAEFEQRRTRESELRTAFESHNEQLGRARANLAAQDERTQSADRDIERLVASIAEGCGAIDRKRAQIADALVANQEGRSELARLQQRRANLASDTEAKASAQQELQRAFMQKSEAIRELDTTMRTVRAQYDAAVTAKHQSELTFAQHQERLSFLRHDIFEKYRVEISDNTTQYLPDGFDATGAIARVEVLREKIANLGGVNAEAIAEYEELQSRHAFLTQQSGDLQSSLDALQRAIVKINRVSRERFVETFAAINERFERLFPKLFRGGGEARLVLVDQENPLESGVDIIAQPPGKKLQNIQLLSGGEKALTAVALIFAMFLVRPSPFCLLDEVDAPLDDANIDRFNDMVREMTQYAQFILITHNKRTMEMADTLYGVTMQEPGISKLVSVKLADRAAKSESTSTAAA